ncbi:hypothetical protein [Romboutsia ilealis]|uniref:hypothetical protein n=1 Tax=Romboutsia ilealis TaxID=1115758 RepID=UPI00259CE38E|nr:hypothetical protein [Romboutsia ilealis]
MIPQKEKEYLLSLKQEDMCYDLWVALFADTTSVVNGKVTVKKSRFSPDDEFVLNPGEYFNTTKVTTNVGLFIYNKYIIENEFEQVLGYWNTPIDKKQLGAIESKLSKALLNQKITMEQMVKYLDKTQHLSMSLHHVICGSFTMNTLMPNKDAMKYRDKFVKEHKKELEAGDVTLAVKLEKDVMDIAKEKLANDHGMDLYDSGARGSFGNNFKTISLMKGPIYNPILGRFEVVTTNFMEGIDKKDIATYANGVVAGAYPKAVGTQESGYLAKQLVAALQTVVLDKKGSDCGSKGYITVTITPELKNDFNYRYIIEGNKLVLIDDSNLDKYVGKTVKMRSPMYCVGKKLCRVCAGTIHEKLEIENIGLTSTKVASTLLNLSMKKFHDTSTKTNEINLNKMTV